MSVISIQSQVAWGHVGNSAAVFPLQMHGIDVIAVPTTLLSNRPGYPSLRGRVLEAPLVADLLRGIEERGAVDTCDMILSGYLGSPEIAAVVADFVARAKTRNPSSLLLRPRARRSRPRPVRCGRHPAAGARPLVPAGRHHHPQSFRVRMSVRGEGHDVDQVIAAAHALMARGPSTVVVTSAELADTPDGEIETLAIEQAVPRPGAWARQSCRSARPAPAICLPRCSSPRAFRERTHGMRSATPYPPSSPCWSAPRRAEPGKCASSRAPDRSFIPRAGSSPSLSAVESLTRADATNLPHP